MRETKIIQVYPSDYAIEKAIKEWEAFGWELTSNQRFSDKQDLWSPAGTTVRTTTYNKLTFSREKNSPWYPEVKRIEEDYEAVQRRISSIKSQKPQKKELGGLDVFLMFFPIPFISLIVYRIIKKVRYKKALKRYENNSSQKIYELESQADRLHSAAESIVNAM